MTIPKHIAIIGCGFTGTSAFYQLVDNYPVEEITIFEATGDFGPGFPYRTHECPDYLINNTTDSMRLVPSNRRAFLEWLRRRPDLAPDPDEKGHLPRAVFGYFLKDVFASTCTSAAVKGIRVNQVPHEVISMKEGADGNVTVSWSEGHIEANAALLTTGRCPDIDRFPTPPAGGARYIASHICCDDLDTLPLDAEVHVIGASLSAYDVLNRLFSPETGCSFQRDSEGVLSYVPGPNRRRAILCSRSGRLKSMQSRHDHAVKRKAFTPRRIHQLAEAGGLDLAALKSLLIEDAETNGAELDLDALHDPYAGCASVDAVSKRAAKLLDRALEAASDPRGINFLVDIFNDASIDIWDLFAEQLLSVEDERYYRSNLETAILCFAAPCPVPTAEKIRALLRAGHLKVINGVRDVRLDDDGDYAITHDFGTETANILVNTIGSVNRNVTDIGQSALIRNLAASGLLDPYERDGVEMLGADVDMTSFRARNTQNIYVANMLLWGPGFFTSSASMMATIVERLLSNLFQDR